MPVGYELIAVLRAEAALAWQPRAAADWPDLRIVGKGPLAAVLGPVANAPGILARLRARDARRTAQGSALEHRGLVLESLMAEGAVLPAASGQALQPDAAGPFLVGNVVAMSGALDALAGQVEYRIQVDWTEDKVLARYRDASEVEALRRPGARVTPQAIADAVARLQGRMANRLF